ncbi:hypothetical protein DL96DRAFT_1819155 [Flagelloscypha sp. PMI_526]|nr:hypothetical protein DL96DRAFT_1819155 [Flagelloscypha sp. PMI_526]
MSPKSLPPELLGIICGFACRCDLPRLALVSRTFLPRAQEILFAKVTIINEPPPVRDKRDMCYTGTRFRPTPGGIATLLTAFALNPSLPHKVLHLRLLFQDRHSEYPNFVGLAYLSTEIANDPLIPRLLDHFHKLQTLSLHFAEPEGLHGIFWGVISDELRKSLSRVLLIPTLKYVDMQLFGEVPGDRDFFRRIPALRCLRFGSPYTLNLTNLANHLDIIHPSSQIPLDSLWFGGEEPNMDPHVEVLSQWFSSPGCPFSLSSLKQLTAHMNLFWDMVGHHHIDNLLRPARESLEVLDFQPCADYFYTSQAPENDPLHLAAFPRLHSLRFWLPFVPGAGGYTPLNWLYHFLSTATSDNLIEDLTIVAHICEEEPGLPAVKHPIRKNWFDLACLLSNKNAFPKLGSVVFEFEYFGGIKQSQFTLQGYVRKRLRPLEKRGVLEMKNIPGGGERHWVPGGYEDKKIMPDTRFPFKPRFTLTLEELSVLSHELLVSQPPKTSDRFVCYLLNGTDEVSNIARHIEKEVFWDIFKLDDASMERLYGKYEHASVFFVVMDTAECRPAGVARVVKNSPAGIPTLNDASKYIGVTVDKFKAYHRVESLDTLWDLSTLAVLKEYRRVEENIVSNILLRATDVRATYEGVGHYVAIVDKHFRRVFAPLGFMGEPIAGSSPVEHEGSTESYFLYRQRPAVARLVLESVNKVDSRLRPSAELFKRRCVDGEGIDHRLMFSFSKDVLGGDDSAGMRLAKL